MSGGRVSLQPSPTDGLLSPSRMATEASAAFVGAVRRAADILQMQPPSVSLPSDPILDLLHQDAMEVEPLLPFGGSLFDTLLGTWARPSSSDPVDRAIAHRHRPAPDDPVCLSLHPRAQGLVVQAAFLSSSAASAH